MQFRLKSLLFLVTLAAIGLGVWMWMESRKLHREARQKSFRELSDEVGQLDEGIRLRLLEMSEVMADLQASRPVDPTNGINHQITGRSSFHGQFQFHRKIHLDWQRGDGTYAEGSTHRMRSVLDEQSSEPHLVEVRYSPSPINQAIADWIKATLEKDGSAEVRQIEERP